MDYISRKSYISLALKAAIIDLDLQKQQPVLEYLLTNLLSQTYSDLAKQLSEKINPKEQNISLNAMQALENEYPLKGGQDDNGNILKYRAVIYQPKITASYDKMLGMKADRIALFQGFTIENYSLKEIREMREHKKIEKTFKKKEITDFEKIRREIDHMVKTGQAQRKKRQQEEEKKHQKARKEARMAKKKESQSFML